MKRFLLAAACSIGLLSAVQAAPADDLRKVLDDHWAWYLSNSPVQASDLGVHTYDMTLGDASLAGMDRQTREAQALVDRLQAIDPKGLSAADRVNRGILLLDLRNQIEGDRFGQRAILFTNREGWHISLMRLAENVPLKTLADYQSYVARLKDYPRLNGQIIETTRAAIKGGYMQYCDSMIGFDKSIETHIVDDPAKSALAQAFAAKPAAISDADWTALKSEGLAAIRDQVIPALQQELAFYRAEYAPKCQKLPGALRQKDGQAYYAYRARLFTTTDMTPQQIHELGMQEVARIRAEMDDVVRKSGFQGDRKAYVEFLRTDPQFYVKTPDDLLRYAGALAKRIDGEMPKLFGRLPRLPYTVKPIPLDIAEGTTTAYYEPGSPETGRAGVYRVNTTKLDQRPLYELVALTMHEAVPGHHHQIALQQELDLPLFRRHAVFFTAFVEGWGLYSERLGLDVGLYETPAQDFGRLSYEMWRACRLVVDTGIHSMGWSRQQAIDFMAANTALSLHNITAEVDRYITWPGQALAYKVGELKIRALRTRAEAALGPRFDIRRFHDAVLENGAVPLSVLETHIDEWIEAEKGRS